jgi:ubiquinone/menaquinone biosynthesis C-methylase UbiE
MSLIIDLEENETAHLAAIEALAGARVLEIGSGDGRMTWRYAALPQSITAFDTDATKLAAAEAGRSRSPASPVSFLQATVEAIPFADEFFDAAVLAWSL